jgi:hypothetical protein
VEIEFDIYEIDSWDGERFEVYSNGELITSDNFLQDSIDLDDSNITGVDLQQNITPLYGSHTSDQTYRYKLRTKLDSSGNLLLEFKTLLEFNPPYTRYWATVMEDIDNESWGIDNVHIKVKETNKKFVCSMTGLGSESQLYCWGNTARSIPILSTSLYDMSKISNKNINRLFITQENEKKNQMSYNLYNSDGNLFLRFPTYIGGFDYGFYFK